MCRLLGVSRSAYYNWIGAIETNKAGEKKKEVEDHIIHIFQEHRCRYGVRRIVAELKANGVQAGAYQVRKVLQQQGLKAILCLPEIGWQRLSPNE